jgi:transmembrane sensor
MNESKGDAMRIENQATYWVAKIDFGLAAEEQDQFLEWLGADQRHGAELAKHKKNWTRLDLLADWRPQHAPEPNRDLLAPRPPALAWLRTHWKMAAMPLAAAAAVAFGTSLFRSQPPEPAPAEPARISAIEQRTLPDGSVLELNRGAQVSVDYTQGERRVRLEKGEANFQVARNPNRPFIVTAGGVDVRAVGTAFNVRLQSSSVEVLVTEGKVQVHAPESATDGRAPEASAATYVMAGERAVIPIATVIERPHVTQVSQEETDRLLAWQPKWIDFDGQSLTQIVAEFNRRNAPLRLVIADPSLGETVVSASFRSDNVENFIRLLEGGFGVRAERDDNVIMLRKVRR